MIPMCFVEVMGVRVRLAKCYLYATSLSDSHDLGLVSLGEFVATVGYDCVIQYKLFSIINPYFIYIYIYIGFFSLIVKMSPIILVSSFIE